jgi:mannose-6-phosphate isomerase-like protein (cupin superfamily)
MNMRSTIACVFAICAAWTGLLPAQTSGDRIGFYFGDWHGAAARTIRGALQQRDIFTPGDAMNPARAGAVLRFINSYTYATLAPQQSTTAVRLDRQQEIYFIESGRGIATAGRESAQLVRNVAVLMPANLQFTLKNTGDEPLAMYVINEPVPANFRPNRSMLVRDESKLPISSTSGMWSHIVKTLFVTGDGLGTLEAVLTVSLDPLTTGKPHPVPGEDTSAIEEVWTALDGSSLAMVGNELRRQTPGMALYHIPDNQTPHSTINQNQDQQVRFLYFARYRPHPPSPQHSDR